MSSTDTTQNPLAASGPPSIPSLNLLDELLFERADIRLVDLDDSVRPNSQREVSAMIDSLRDREALPTTEEQKDELRSHGLDPDDYPDRSSAGKTLYVARRRQAALDYAEQKAVAATKLDAIFAQAEANHQPVEAS